MPLGRTFFSPCSGMVKGQLASLDDSPPQLNNQQPKHIMNNNGHMLIFPPIPTGTPASPRRRCNRWPANGWPGSSVLPPRARSSATSARAQGQNRLRAWRPDRDLTARLPNPRRPSAATSCSRSIAWTKRSKSQRTAPASHTVAQVEVRPVMEQCPMIAGHLVEAELTGATV